MNLNQLYYFRELADQKQYTKAADNLFISQPTLSISIKQLENELQCKLFNHNGRYVQLTEYGRIFYDTVTKSLNTLDRGKKQIEQRISQDQGNIHIAGIPTAIGTILPHLTKQYQQESNISLTSSTTIILHIKFAKVLKMVGMILEFPHLYLNLVILLIFPLH
ncbi:LysR family transcriptional regulator [Lactobacillus sp. R2/2]|nr:LysR family transcriptional regulator [Lactobacillus sp. R2/2]